MIAWKFLVLTSLKMRGSFKNDQKKKIRWKELKAGFFPSTFQQSVNGSKNSILNWVIKLNLIEIPMKL